LIDVKENQEIKVEKEEQKQKETKPENKENVEVKPG